MKTVYPLLENAFNSKDISLGLSVVKKKQLTMSKITKNFEKQFSKYVGSKYAVMVNSGSSANLLSVFAAKSLYNLKNGDEVIVPSLCWSTSLWPIIQAGLKPVFVDINLKNYNACVDEILKKITKKTKIILIIHVLGTSLNLDLLKKKIKRKILIIEDTCESLGTKYKNKYLGNFGEFGTYSFYYSHQITCGEGGMIVTNIKKNYEMLKIMRAHGWDRDINKKNEKNFNFINMGFNLRPLEISAAIASNQLKRLKNFSKIRNKNKVKIINSIRKHSNWDNQFYFVETEKYLKPSWFGLPLLLNKKYLPYKNSILKHLKNNGIETRPIISGNFLNQPSIKLYKLNRNKENFPQSQEIEDRGFFIGIHVNPINKETLNNLEKKLLKIDEI